MGSKLQNTKLQQEPNTVEALRTWVLGDNSPLVTEHGGAKPIDRADAQRIHRAPPIQEMHPGEPQVPLQSDAVSRDAPPTGPDDFSTNNTCTSGNSNTASSEAAGDPPRIVDPQPPLRLKPSVIRRALETTALGIVVIAIGAITIAALLGDGDKADVATFSLGTDKAKVATSSEPETPVQLTPQPTPPNLELQRQLESVASQLTSLRNAVEQSGVKQRQMEEQLTSLKDSQQALNRSVAALAQNAQSSSRRSARRHYSRP